MFLRSRYILGEDLGAWSWGFRWVKCPPPLDFLSHATTSKPAWPGTKSTEKGPIKGVELDFWSAENLLAHGAPYFNFTQ